MEVATKTGRLIKLLEDSDLPMTRTQILKHFDKSEHRTVLSALSLNVSTGRLSILDKALYTSAGFGDYRKGVERPFCYKALNDFLQNQREKGAIRAVKCMWSNRDTPMSIEQIASEAKVNKGVVYRLRHDLIKLGWRFVVIGSSQSGKLYSMNNMIKK